MEGRTLRRLGKRREVSLDQLLDFSQSTFVGETPDNILACALIDIDEPSCLLEKGAQPCSQRTDVAAAGELSPPNSKLAIAILSPIWAVSRVPRFVLTDMLMSVGLKSAGTALCKLIAYSWT